MNNQELANTIEALLFTGGGSATRASLSKKLGVAEAELESGIHALSSMLAGQGLALVDDGRTVELRAAPSTAAAVEKVAKEEFSRDVGRAGLEALAAILYRGPLSRSEIDFIRGVNSSQTLRTLLMRGLIRKVSNPKDERAFLYEPTTELLAELGIVAIADLPEYAQVKQKLSELEAAYRAQESAPTDQPSA